ncbi:hypothetical protein C8A00DRAFT_46435 [Chaetomidium leptoderma]|uniref:Aminoglycoside phosphotransferase domain-containing protein n=1 Tax=Chaetomidium leptoderma TaxID=669021 RepID=A0AAN6ZV79_9PEZI|nr:hypothetical protein C8A00DRAFT_46435 [Chaetomidium leptoderma]
MASDSPIALDAILALASSIRDDGAPATFCFGTDEKPFDSGYSQIYALKFLDNVTWAVEIPVQAGKSLGREAAVGAFVESHATTLTQLDKSGFRWSPKLIRHDTGHDNLIKHPYLVLSWIHGTELEWTDTVPSKPQNREKILRQVVDIRLELAECTMDLRPEGSEPTLEFLTSVVDGKIMRAATGKEPSFGIRDCLTHRALVRHVVNNALDSELFVLSHEALAAHNIIVDSDYNITGLVGWAFARTIPMQLALRLPRFLAIEPDSARETASQPPPDIPAFAKKYLQPSPALMADRQLVLSYLSSFRDDPDQRWRVILARSMKDVLSDIDANWRYLIIEACFGRGLHAWLANRSWLVDGTEGVIADFLVDFPSEKELVRQVEEFLEADDTEDESIREALLAAVNSS